MTSKLILKRILTLSKLNALGFNNNKLNSKVLHGNLNTIKSIYNRYIRYKYISNKDRIKSLI
ncbi:unnamed protein product, partial [marine sediment metagenome]